MVPITAQVFGIAFASGLNLYATVAALGIAARLGLVELPPGLVGLESFIVLSSALVLYVTEAVIDKVRHADSLWDAVHTFIRPPAAALLAVGVLWGQDATLMAVGAATAFLVALVAHTTKAGLRLALNTRRRHLSTTWISVLEDLAAVVLAITAMAFPLGALVAAVIAATALLVRGPRLWRAFTLGIRCLTATVRAFFGPSRWKEGHELPGRVRNALGDPPMGSPPPRGARAGIHGAPGVGAYRSGWLLIAPSGPMFFYRTFMGLRHFEIPDATAVRVDPGAWADLVHVENGSGTVTLYLLRDGPATEVTVAELRSPVRRR